MMKPRRRAFTINRPPSVSISAIGEIRRLAPVSLPKLIFVAGEIDLKEAAQEILTTRTIRKGRDAFEQITKAESFEAWKAIGAALAIGKAHALRVTGANAPWGRNYSREFGAWIKQHGFDTMRPSDRSYAIELHENRAAIAAWRDSLPEHKRRRLIGAQANVKRWRATTGRNGRCPQDLRRNAMAAWRRFVSCAGLLPPDEAMPLWRSVSAEVTSYLHAPAPVRVEI
jgi:hypothetical protein